MAPEPTPKVTFTSDAADSYSDDEDQDDSSSSVAASSREGSSGVILGFEDGELGQEHAGDEMDISVSRLGGRAHFPLLASSLPPPELSLCPLCSKPMTLLTQIYAPLPADSLHLKSLSKPYPSNKYREEFDRLLYIFGCLQKGCTGVRCLRSARRNERWAQQGKQERKRKAEAAAKAKVAKDTNPFGGNPFASSSSSASDNPFASSAGGQADFGSLIFGGADETASQASTHREDEQERENNGSSTAELSSQPSAPWPILADNDTQASVVAPRYLTTSYEYLAPTSANSKQAKLASQLSSMNIGEDKDGPHKGGRIAKSGEGKSKTAKSAGGEDDAGWSQEGYEIMRLAGVEATFLAFQERLELGGAADQVIRYEFGGTPLPFSGKSKPFDLLWTDKPAPGTANVVSRQAHSAISAGQRRYDSACSKLSKCSHCGSPRTFEVQLMPHLVTVVEEALRRESSAGKDEEAELEIGWATVWCFVCSADCLDAEAGKGEGDDETPLDWQGWREEVAMVELED